MSGTRRNKYGWTPLTIARGYRFGNFKPSPVTVAAVEEVMLVGRRHAADRKGRAGEGVRHLRAETAAARHY